MRCPCYLGRFGRYLCLGYWRAGKPRWTHKALLQDIAVLEEVIAMLSEELEK